MGSVGQEPVQTTITHPGTGRRAAIVRVRNFAAASPLRSVRLGDRHSKARRWVDGKGRAGLD
jgi:hypothetical protein